jgi:hypothetical protein
LAAAFAGNAISDAWFHAPLVSVTAIICSFATLSMYQPTAVQEPETGQETDSRDENRPVVAALGGSVVIWLAPLHTPPDSFTAIACPSPELSSYSLTATQVPLAGQATAGDLSMKPIVDAFGGRGRSTD